VRVRLAPSLVALLEQGPEAAGATAVVAGWVRVRVELVVASATAVRDLQAAGLQIEAVERNRVVGLVRVCDLAALAGSEAVRWIEPAEAPPRRSGAAAHRGGESELRR
jgi:hypothetical protein